MNSSAQDIFDHLKGQDERAFRVQGIKYYQAEIDLIGKQEKYTEAIKKATNRTMWATIVMAIATVVIAFFSYLQWHQSSKMAEANEKPPAQLSTPR